MRAVTLLRSGNRFVVEPTTPETLEILRSVLTYAELKFFYGEELRKRRARGQSRREEVLWECFAMDHRQRLGTSLGLRERVTAALQEKGYTVAWRYASERDKEQEREKKATIFKPDWERIAEIEAGGFEFRYGQREALEVIAREPYGRIDCPTAWGKGDLVRLVCSLFPKAKIAVVTRHLPVLMQRLYPALAVSLPSVGIVCSGRKILGKRVMCYSSGSLQHARGDEDMILADECHEAASDDCAYKLGRFLNSRFWGFSASHDQRLDNKDMRVEALFGPVRFKVSYQEAVAAGMIAQLEVVWSDVALDVNPCLDEEGWKMKKLGIWANARRNEIIAADARHYSDDTQVLIVVETVEHALHLKRLLPEFEMVYSGAALKERQYRSFFGAGLITEDFQPLADERREALTKAFERGTLKKVIATSVWNVGVNFTKLDILIRADAGGSSINDTQIPGRNSRSQNKNVGIIHDYLDQFDKRLAARATKRRANYELHGWPQHFPKDDDKRPLLRRLMGWEA